MGDLGQVLDADGVAEAVAKAAQGVGDVARGTGLHGQARDVAALRPDQQPVADLAHDPGVQRRDRLGRLQQARQSQGAVGQRAVERGDEHAPARRAADAGRRLQRLRHLAQHRQVQFEHQNEARRAGLGLEHPADRRRLDPDHQGLAGAVFQLLAAEIAPLGALGHQAHSRSRQDVTGRLGMVRAHDRQAGDRREERALAGLALGVAQQGFGQGARHRTAPVWDGLNVGRGQE